jgi:hypothetical protein
VAPPRLGLAAPLPAGRSGPREQYGPFNAPERSPRPPESASEQLAAGPAYQGSDWLRRQAYKLMAAAGV